MPITLIGYRGSGKSSVAPALAARLGYDWIDADVLLESRAGRTIRQIFAESGEPEFRRLERETLQELLQRDRLVIAAGGGAILNPDTRKEMRAAGPVVWLRASVTLLESRIAADAVTAERRPALSSSGRDDIAQLLAAREPLYQECATVTVATDHLTVEQVVDRVVAGLPVSEQPPSGRGPA
jgi:shikimate kinase